jgi:hypothetical protein
MFLKLFENSIGKHYQGNIPDGNCNGTPASHYLWMERQEKSGERDEYLGKAKGVITARGLK